MTILAVHEKGIDAGKLKAWLAESAITFPVGIITGDPGEVKYAWGIQSLPWLILTDRNHLVMAEGFAITELDGCLRKMGEN